MQKTICSWSKLRGDIKNPHMHTHQMSTSFLSSLCALRLTHPHLVLQLPLQIQVTLFKLLDKISQAGSPPLPTSKLQIMFKVINHIYYATSKFLNHLTYIKLLPFLWFLYFIYVWLVWFVSFVPLTHFSHKPWSFYFEIFA